jgi:hypothetical protein
MFKMLNLPTTLPQTENTLYFGLGGGYDIFGAIPIHEALKSNAVFVNISESVNMGHYEPFYPLQHKGGAYTLAARLSAIVKEHDIDTIIGIDGGVDCLMHGDEEHAGTVLQDFISLAALDNLKHHTPHLPNIVIACLGFGCETEENLNHYAVLENIAQLVRDNAFIGSCSLTGDMAEYAAYKYAIDNYSSQRKSHIQTRVIAAIEGQFGNVNLGEDANLSSTIFDTPSPTFLNPLMSMYWFFRLNGIVKNNLIIPHIKESRTLTDALIAYRKVVTRTRLKKVIPL